MKLESVKLEDLGRAKKVTIDKDNTTIVEGKGKGDRDRRPGEAKSARQIERPPAITIARSCRSGWRNWWAAWP